MFTGIVEEKGTLRRVTGGADWGSLTVGCRKVLEGTRIGDSIAVNGVCLTVTECSRDSFTADVMAETLRRSNLGDLKAGDAVNLERAMAADGRFGGHLVSGHIDGTGIIQRVRREGNAVWVFVEAPAAVLDLIVEKGSVAVDGISLTVAQAGSDGFAVFVIPHTGEETTLLARRRGERVNLENDIVGKYVQKLLGCSTGGMDTIPAVNAAGGGEAAGAAEPKTGVLTEAYLREHGF